MYCTLTRIAQRAKCVGKVGAVRGVHNVAQVGFAKSAETYDSFRPSYPSEAVDHIMKECVTPVQKANDEVVVVDVGAGTGIFTRLLLEKDLSVAAIEPVEKMRQALEESIRGSRGKLRVMEGGAEEIPLPSSSVDVVTCAQAFHWFASHDSLKEFHRVLRPQRRLALVWNLEDRERGEKYSWVGDMRDFFEEFEGEGTPQFRKDEWRAAFLNQNYFEAIGERRFLYEESLRKERLVERIMTRSYISRLEESEKNRVRTELRSILDQHNGAADEEIVCPYFTLVSIWTRAEVGE